MNAIAEDLWPADIAKDRIRTPVSILRAQAAHLGQKTSNLVEGRVDTLTREDLIYHRFKLVAPALDNYTYELFRISHPATMYPIDIEEEPDEMKAPIRGLPLAGRSVWQTLNSEEELVDWLRKVFASKQTKRVVDALVSQSTDWATASRQ